MNNILITGGAGFVGSRLAISLKKKYPDYQITCLDNLKRRGSELNLPTLKYYDILFQHGDIRNKEDFDSLIPTYDLIIEASAEPSVLAGVEGSPDYVINTNLVGTLNCLSFARRCNAKVIFLSTSRVYPIETLNNILFEEQPTRFQIAGNQTLTGVSKKGITEDFSLSGARSFYGASKLASELMIHEYASFYDVETVINRCGVLTGPGQMGKVDQGVVVLWVARHFRKGKLDYFGYGGNGKQLRDILHIDDFFDLIDFQIHHFDTVKNQIFNVGGGVDVSISLCELTAICEEVTGNKIAINKVKEDRTADIRIYVSDHSKITKITNWHPKRTPVEVVTDIFHWIEANESQLKNILH